MDNTVEYTNTAAREIERITEQLVSAYHKQDDLAHHRALEQLNELRSQIEYKEAV